MLLMLCFTMVAYSDASATIEDQDYKEIFTMSEEMVAFLDEYVDSSHNTRQRMTSLVFAIFDKDKLNLVYGNNETKTARETFETRSGNCLSFTTMFVVMARYLGINAYFQEVVDVSRWDRRGDVVMNNKHINVRVIINGRFQEIDFYPFQEKRKHAVRRINDRRAAAHYYNNKGAEAFALRQLSEAKQFFDKALSLDDSFARTWSNMGVLYKHQGLLKQAEEAYLTALKHNRYEYTAMSNLVQLYQVTGNIDGLQRYKSKVDRHRRRNPYFHLAAGDAAFERGDVDEAIHSFKKAVRLHTKEPDFYHALAKAYYRRGDMKKVKRYLRLAKKWADPGQDQERYEEKLQALVANHSHSIRASRH